MVRNFRGVWNGVHPREGVTALPKGHPEGKEPALDAAAREVREEAGVEGERSGSSTTSATGTCATASKCSSS